MKIKTIKGKGNQESLHFKSGGLHASLGVASDKKIPASKFHAALSGKKGGLAEKQAEFAKNVLHVKK